MRHSSLTEKQFAKNYEAVCNVAAEVYGRGHFDGDFISVKDTSEKDICETISHILKMNNNDVERYIYVTTINDTTLIKKYNMGLNPRGFSPINFVFFILSQYAYRQSKIRLQV